MQYKNRLCTMQIDLSGV